MGGGWFGRIGWSPAGSAMAWHDWALCQDRAGHWWFESLGPESPDDDGQTAAFERCADAVATAVTAGEPAGGCSHLTAVRHDDAQTHMRHVVVLQEAIAAGEIYQANLCGRVSAAVQGDPLLLWVDAAATLRPPYGAWLPGYDAVPALAAWSPELFLRREGRDVQTAPIKGTRPAPAEPMARAAAGRDLLESAKERAEHVMIVDLVRNDLGRVCEPGSIGVPRLLELDPAPGLWHLVSLVRGRLREGVDDSDLLAATFPPGSVSGAPKLAAVELIENVEPWPRLAYTGGYGVASPVLGLQLAVTIRSLEIAADGAAWLGVGGGITAGSDPLAEWQECLHKAGPIIAACGGVLPR